MKRIVIVGMVLLLALCGIASAEIWYDEDGLIHDDDWQQPPSADELLYQMFSDMAAQQREQTRNQIQNQYGGQAVEQYNQVAQCYDCSGSGVAGSDDYLGREMYSGSCAYCLGNGQCSRCYGSGQAF